LHGSSGRETVEDGAGRLPLLKGPFEPKKVRMTFRRKRSAAFARKANASVPEKAVISMLRTLKFLATVDPLLHTAVGQLPPQVPGYTICLKPNTAGTPVSAFWGRP